MMLLPMIAMASETFTIGDRVWHDTNENWEEDSGEKGMADVKVMLYTESGTKLKTTTTNKEGTYHFYGIKEGDYVVKVVAPEGTEIVTESKRELWLDKNRKDIDFGLHNKNHKGDYSIGDRVWNDTNENWEQDKNETGIAGVKVNLFKASGEKVSSTKTNRNGNYSFEELPEGDYVVKVVAPEGTEIVTEPKRELWLDKNRKDIDFGLHNKNHKGDYSIGDRVWNDTNENWEQDKNETGIAGVKVNLFKASGEKVSSTKTNRNGNYSFEELPEGDYVVKVEVPKDMTAITDTKLEVWLDKSRVDKDFGLLKKSTPPNGKPITLERLKEMIANGEDVTKVNTSEITDMSGLFAFNETFNQDISGWDVSKVTNMSAMFRGAKAFNQPIGNWDVSKVTNMNEMFEIAEAFNQPIGNWDVSKVTNMRSMFSRARVFNQPINNWNISNVIDMAVIFSRAIAFNQPLNNWDVSNITNMEKVFRGAEAFNQPLNSWDVSNVFEMGQMFRGAEAFNQSLNNWDVSKVEDMTQMFDGAKSFNQDISMWSVENVHRYRAFYNKNYIADEKIPEKFRQK